MVALHIVIFTDIIKDEERPKIAELYKDVAPKYAIYWEELGASLGLQKYHIDIISKNNAYNPNRALDCSKSMLKKWLEIDTKATWDKLNNAIAVLNKQGMDCNTLNIHGACDIFLSLIHICEIICAYRAMHESRLNQLLLTMLCL